MRTQLETLGEEFKLAGNIWWREPTILWVLDLEMHWHCEDNGHIGSSYLSESFVMRCFGIVRTIPTSSSSWPMDHTLDLMVCILSFLRRLWLSLWGRHCFWDDFGLQCGLAITVVERLQRYNCIWLTYIDNVEQNILFYIEILKLWDAISMWKADLEKECYVRTMFCIQKKVVQIPCVNHFVLVKLVSKLTNELVIHVWMRTSLIWELLEVFRCFWIHLVKLSFVDL